LGEPRVPAFTRDRASVSLKTMGSHTGPATTAVTRLVSQLPVASITSPSNPWLKRFRKALAGKETDLGFLLGLEGPKLVAEAIRSNLKIVAVLVSASGEKFLHRLGDAIAAREIRTLRTSDRQFRSVATTQHPQGIAALAEPRQWSLAQCLESGSGPAVVLCGLQDPGNLGTVIRSAEAFGGSGVVAIPGTVSAWNPKALRASAGAALRLPIVEGVPVEELLAELNRREMGLVIAVAHDARGSAVTPEEIDWRRPLALAIGSETGGVPETLAVAAQYSVWIPLKPPLESLNAAVAASILLYEAARQRRCC